MRRTLEPADVFDKMSERIPEELRKRFSPSFKAIRREAERKVNGVISGIKAIYDEISNIVPMSQAEKDDLVQLEIETEKQVLIPRSSMVNLLKFAKNQGKKVNLVTDMYLPKDFLEDVLHGCGITEYDQIFLSCEFGINKGKGLFKRYLSLVESESYLHIGDNSSADKEEPETLGINCLIIPSAIELL